MSIDSKSKLIRILSVVGDVTTVFLSVIISFRISGIYTDICNVTVGYGLAFVIAVVFSFIMLDLYSLKAENIYNALISAGISVLIAYFCVYVLSRIVRVQQLPIIFWSYLLAILMPAELVWRMIVAFAKKKTGQKRSLLIIENMKNTSRLARKLKYASNEENRSWYHMLDETDDDEMQTLLNKMLPKFDAVFISSHISNKVAEKILFKALTIGKEANILADVDGVTTLKGRIYQIDDTPAIVKKGIHLTNFQKTVKRSFDILIALIGSIVTLPVILICAAAIKLDSKGPVFYKQERYTINKKVFNVYKLRTMFTDAEKNGAQFATENDPRITRVGRVLRALRVDELPQIYNILAGSMSVVGPRPERPVFADEFSKAIASYDMRYCLKAGLTGYAQVYGKYNTRVSDKILMDITYGTTYSLLLDVKLILLTIKIMFMKSATQGVDEEYDANLSAPDKEAGRRASSKRFMEYIKDIDQSKEEKNNEKNIRDYSGV